MFRKKSPITKLAVTVDINKNGYKIQIFSRGHIFKRNCFITSKYVIMSLPKYFSVKSFSLTNYCDSPPVAHRSINKLRKHLFRLHIVHC